MKKALIIGIDKYHSYINLKGCVEDANNMYGKLLENEDQTPNFTCKKYTTDMVPIVEVWLRKLLTDFFENEADLGLFYFSGHGIATPSGTFLVSTDASSYNEGIALNELIELASRSKIRNKILVLDCCHSGDAGNLHFMGKNISILPRGVTILASATLAQKAVSDKSGSKFTRVILEALDGGAADLLGNITLARLYDYIDSQFDPFEQRPVLKAYLTENLPLRKISPPTGQLETLKAMARAFPSKKQTKTLNLDADIIGKLERLNLIREVKTQEAEKKYSLTHLGMYYWTIVRRNIPNTD